MRVLGRDPLGPNSASEAKSMGVINRVAITTNRGHENSRLLYELGKNNQDPDLALYVMLKAHIYDSCFHTAANVGRSASAQDHNIALTHAPCQRY
jgi:hypothetical protein